MNISSYKKGLLSPKHIIIFLIVNIFLSIPSPIYAKETSPGISVRYYLSSIQKAFNIESSKPITLALSKGLIKDGECSNYDDPITNEYMAVIANRADKTLSKGTIEQKIYDNTKNLKRISDISNATSIYKEDLYEAFSKGIYVGNSNGLHSQTRTLNPKKNADRDVAFLTIKKLNNKKSRTSISPDGQVIRKTKLPKNYKDYNYILESFPNAFYEKKFVYEGLKPKRHITINNQNRWEDVIYKELVDYTRPVTFLLQPRPLELFGEEFSGDELRPWLENGLYSWCDMIETNLSCRLNVNYKTIGDKWFSKIRKTYAISEYDTNKNKNISTFIKNYISYVKTEKIILESRKIIVEPSSLYSFKSQDYIRCYVEFRMVSAKDLKKVATEGKYILTGGTSTLTEINNCNWINMYVDIPFSKFAGTQTSIFQISPF